MISNFRGLVIVNNYANLPLVDSVVLVILPCWANTIDSELRKDCYQYQPMRIPTAVHLSLHLKRLTPIPFVRHCFTFWECEIELTHIKPPIWAIFYIQSAVVPTLYGTTL